MMLGYKYTKANVAIITLRLKGGYSQMFVKWWQVLIKAVDNLLHDAQLEIPSGRASLSAQTVIG